MTDFLEQFIILSLEVSSLFLFATAYQNLSIRHLGKRILYLIPLIFFNSCCCIFIASELYCFLMINAIIFLFSFIIYKTNFNTTLAIMFFSYISTILLETLLFFFLAMLPFKRDSFLFLFIGNSLLLLVSFFICRYIPLWKIYQPFYKLGWALKFSIYNVLLLILFFILLTKFHPDNIIITIAELFPILILLICVNAEFFTFHHQEQQNQKQLQAYEEYLPIIEELITQVRDRQHDHNNNIQAIQMLPVSYTDYDSLKAALIQYGDYLSHDAVSFELLQLNLNVVSGFLISKQHQAISVHKQLDISIKNYKIETDVPEYCLIDIIGIVTDNALEATPEKETALLTLNSSNHRMIIETKNVGTLLTEELKNQMFSKGSTTKKQNNRLHGIGLYKLKKIVDNYHGSIILSNEKDNNKIYLCITVIV